MMRVGPKFLGVVFGVLLASAVVVQGLLAENNKVIKKVPTTHKVVSL